MLLMPNETIIPIGTVAYTIFRNIAVIGYQVANVIQDT
jgi:hypothetical protein